MREKERMRDRRSCKDILLDDKWATEEVKKEILKILECCENEHAAYQNLWDTRETSLKVITLKVHIKRI